MAAARQNRHGHRDSTMILVAFRHGLRASELVSLRWEQVDYQRAVLHVRRVKGGTPGNQPIRSDPSRVLGLRYGQGHRALQSIENIGSIERHPLNAMPAVDIEHIPGPRQKG
jgi:integrase